MEVFLVHHLRQARALERKKLKLRSVQAENLDTLLKEDYGLPQNVLKELVEVISPMLKLPKARSCDTDASFQVCFFLSTFQSEIFQVFFICMKV